MKDAGNFNIERDGKDVFVVVNGLKIAKRGHPGTPQAGLWVTIEPGWYVVQEGNGLEIVHSGVRLQ